MSVTIFDAAYPNPAVDPKVAGALVYIGGDTQFVWTEAQIKAAHGAYRLPCYVRSNPQNADPVGDAGQALAWLQAHGVPKGCAVVLDLETAVNAVYVLAFGNRLHAAGYLVWPYGSPSTLFKNPKLDGYFAAEYDFNQTVDTRCVAKQWADYPNYDLDDVYNVSALWNPSAPAPTPPAPAPEEDEELMEVWNDGTAEYLWSGGWLTHVPDAPSGSALTSNGVAPYTAVAVKYRHVPASLTAAILAEQKVRLSVAITATPGA